MAGKVTPEAARARLLLASARLEDAVRSPLSEKPGYAMGAALVAGLLVGAVPLARKVLWKAAKWYVFGGRRSPSRRKGR